MTHSPRSRSALTLAAALLALQWSLAAQMPAGRPHAPPPHAPAGPWKLIQGTRLWDDGQWLAYATTAPGDDGEVVVRSLRTGQEYRQARGTAPQFTPDARFVVFTIAQPKAEEEREAQANANAPGEEAPAAGRGGRGNQRAREPRTGLGIMSLQDGQVKTFEKVGSFSLPERSSTWLAYYKGLGAGGGRGGGRGGAQGARGAGGGRGAASAGAQSATGAPGAREKRQDTGADLIIRNLGTGEEVTV